MSKKRPTDDGLSDEKADKRAKLIRNAATLAKAKARNPFEAETFQQPFVAGVLELLPFVDLVSTCIANARIRSMCQQTLFWKKWADQNNVRFAVDDEGVWSIKTSDKSFTEILHDLFAGRPMEPRIFMHVLRVLQAKLSTDQFVAVLKKCRKMHLRRSTNFSNKNKNELIWRYLFDAMLQSETALVLDNFANDDEIHQINAMSRFISSQVIGALLGLPNDYADAKIASIDDQAKAARLRAQKFLAEKRLLFQESVRLFSRSGQQLDTHVFEAFVALGNASLAEALLREIYRIIKDLYNTQPPDRRPRTMQIYNDHLEEAEKIVNDGWFARTALTLEDLERIENLVDAQW